MGLTVYAVEGAKTEKTALLDPKYECWRGSGIFHRRLRKWVLDRTDHLQRAIKQAEKSKPDEGIPEFTRLSKWLAKLLRPKFEKPPAEIELATPSSGSAADLDWQCLLSQRSPEKIPLPSPSAP